MYMAFPDGRRGMPLPPEAEPRVDEEQAWSRLLALAGREAGVLGSRPAQSMTSPRGGKFPSPNTYAAQSLLDLYLPLCRGVPERFVVGHLGQSLDGRIATANGASRWVTGPEDVLHNQRMRALFDAVLVGAGTVREDDPQLTVRDVRGRNPVRVIVDPKRRLGPACRVFIDGEAETLLLCDARLARPGERRGQAEVVGVARENGRLEPAAVLERLAVRGLTRVFVEGGGITISHFLGAGCLDRLQITVAPLIIGSGRPSIILPEIQGPSAGLRPPMRHHPLGQDVLFECRFNA